MINLSLYEQAFDRAYPDYATNRYRGVVFLTDRLADLRLLDELESDEFRKFMALMEPLIKIKNYKSQVPFPVDVGAVLRCAIQLKTFPIPDDPLSGESERIFLSIVEQDGFQLPTVSALFHFCHANSFPIVDRNVEAACEILKDAHESDFNGLSAPKLPVSTTSPNNKLSKYRAFIAFIDRVKALQIEQYGGQPDYRFIDKALMVIGVDRLRRQVEDAQKAG